MKISKTLFIFCTLNSLSFEGVCRVGHLMLGTLAVWASDPQNAVAQTSFHLPKSSLQPF